MSETKFRVRVKNLQGKWDIAGQELLESAEWRTKAEGQQTTVKGTFDILPAVKERDPFTGQVDKNGKEIYGGDVLNFDNGQYCALVVFEPPLISMKGTVNAPLWPQNSSKTVVMGNIYQNPELMDYVDGTLPPPRE